MIPKIPDREEIAVDIEMLARILDVTPETISLYSWMDHYAARAITDAVGGDRKTTATYAIAGARAWIQYAYDKGKEAGSRAEREHWKNKIVRLFDL